MRWIPMISAVPLLLWFTGPDVARAEPARPAAGPTARVGTAVGFSQIADETVGTLGVEVGVGYRFGPFSIEAQLDHASMLQQRGADGSNEVRGELGRWGVNARVHAPALRWPGSLEPDSVLRLFGEVGGGRQRGSWTTGEEFHRTDVTVGGGWLLDHSMQPRTGVPFRSIGWHMGWQLRASRAEQPDMGVELTTCKKCGPPMPREADPDLALVVSCSLAATW